MRIKNPVGVGETYGVRREETLRTRYYVRLAKRVRSPAGIFYFNTSLEVDAKICRTFPVISAHRASGLLLTVMKSLSSKRLLTPGMLNNLDATG